ncbi:hypothetical protein HBH98_177170 [Parastagonospora nodorum]|nr:hypothetical protein HBI95_083540 [Parastagonospora nodorum]KAH4262360.1 hypothetical protein HBI03_111830 [Parastagonospora nodorum]KAH4281138.1 hypothetical protein HBI04_053340 [Parastagonospora nodorum]KAH4341362.1 hypothetical protein HBH98_177170 [Parastagonospora nodorum]KAH4369419.1 hypothetical protein HBH97_148310 [Parastagonospora nodorum]
MSAVESQKPVEVPVAGATETAPAPVEPVKIDVPVEEAFKTEEPKTEGEAAVAAEEKKDEKVEAKPAEPIYSGALGYKAPGLKNAFRFSKKYFWFGEEAVPATNLREYLRGEKPEVAHPVAAWSSQTGKGLLYFVKHAEQKEHPAGVLNLAYATDLHKDGADAFAFKISGSKHAFEAQTTAERDGWYLAVEKAIADAKEAKEGIESSEGYKEQKEKIGKPTTLAAATASTPKKSTDATPKAAEADAPVAAGDEAVVAAPARTGSSSSSSSDEEKKAKKTKSKSRSASRKRASLFGGLLGKKDKAEEKKDEAESSKAQPEAVKEETPVVPVTETSTTAPVITQEIPEASQEIKTDGVPATTEEAKTEETAVKAVDEKPKPTKRGSIFGSFFEKVKSPTSEKKEADLVPAPIAKDTEADKDASKPLEEAQVAVPATVEPVSEPTAVKTDEAKPAASTPVREKQHFQFGKLFGNKDRSKSPAATDKVAEPTKVDAVAPQIEETPVTASTEPTEPVVVAPVTEAKAEPVAAEKKEKRSSIFGSLGRSLSKAAKGKDPKDSKKETTTPTTVPETAEPKEEAVIAPTEEKKDDVPVVPATTEQTIGDVTPGAVNVGDSSKSAPVATTA